jgi:hypothetical protein
LLHTFHTLQTLSQKLRKKEVDGLFTMYGISLKMACGSKNRESARDSLCLITINPLAHVQRRIVIIFYVEEKNYV